MASLPRVVPARSRASLLALALLGLALATGCGGARPRQAFTPPTFAFLGVDLERIDLSGVTFALRVRVHNPNDLQATVDRLGLELSLDGRALASVKAPRALELPAGGSRDLELEVRVGTAAAAGIVQRVRSQAPKSWRLQGTAFLDTPLGRRDVPVDLSGDFR